MYIRGLLWFFKLSEMVFFKTPASLILLKCLFPSVLGIWLRYAERAQFLEAWESDSSGKKSKPGLGVDRAQNLPQFIRLGRTVQETPKLTEM